MKVSWLTAVFSIYFVISSSFMRYVYNYLFMLINKNSLILTIIILIGFIIAFIVILIYLVKQKKLLRIIPAAVVVGLIILYSFTLDIIAERIHLIQFGLVGFLISLDNLKENKPENYFFVLLWCFILASLDEIFQYFLPSRVGDIRDVWTGFFGSIIGAFLYLALFLKVKFKNKNNHGEEIT